MISNINDGNRFTFYLPASDDGMQVETLKIFCDVAKLGSFSKGAEENNVTQSMASQSVHQLEDHLGVQLIDRAVRPWKLTPEGKHFYTGMQEILERYFALENGIRALHEQVTSLIRVASIYSAGLLHMRQFVEAFAKTHPHIHVHLEYLHPRKVYEAVLSEKADFGIVSFPASRRDLSIVPWRVESMVLACHPEHPLARESAIEPARISGDNYVHFDRDLVIRKEIDRFLKHHGVEINVAMEFDNIEAIKHAVEAGIGVSVLPRPTLAHEVRTGTLAAVPFRNVEFHRPLAVISRKRKKLTSNMKCFLERIEREKNVPAPPRGNRAGRARSK
jgi:DNA-binding transcriptional LysR family regulator